MNTTKGILQHLDTDGSWPSFVLSDANDCIPSYIRHNGHWELDLVNDALKYIDVNKPGIVLDIGANIGVWSVYLSKHKNLNIHSFEPYLPTYYNLCSNLLLNKAFNCKSHRCALGNMDEYGKKLPMYVVPYNIGMTKLSEDSNFEKAEFEASMDYLDRIFPTEIVSFIKIDVEGHEEHVLRGGEYMIKRSKPVIYFESWNCRPELREPLFRYIIDLGYEIQHINGDDYRAIPINILV